MGFAPIKINCVVQKGVNDHTLVDLARHRGRVRSREKLLEAVWNHPSTLETRTVDTHIKRISTLLRFTKEKTPEKIERDLMELAR